MVDTRQWHKFTLDSLFEIRGSKTTPKRKLEEYGQGSYPYVTTQASNNGVAGFYNYYTEDGNCLTIDSAVLGTCFYQDRPFSASDHVEVLRPKFLLTRNVALFLVTLINQEHFRYCYGRKFNQKKIRNTSIKLPVLETGEIDFGWIETFMSGLTVEQEQAKILNSFDIVDGELPVSQFKMIALYDLFDFMKGCGISRRDRGGMIPYVSATAKHNGIDGYVTTAMLPEKCITISCFSDAFYQETPTWISGDMVGLIPKFEISKLRALYICTLLTHERFRFSYGRKLTLKQISTINIKMPVTENGEINWHYIDVYMSNIMRKIKA